MNRTWIRGVNAGVGSGLVLAVIGITVPAIAHGAQDTVDFSKPLPIAEQQAAIDRPAPHIGRFLRHVHAVPAHRRVYHASRALHRSSLTGSPRVVAHALVLRHGWSGGQWTCLDALWARESHWSPYAQNSSGAYGIPQALPGSKMASFGGDWRTNPVTQIRWGLSYISQDYGSPCSALAHSNAYGYY